MQGRFQTRPVPYEHISLNCLVHSGASEGFSGWTGIYASHHVTYYTEYILRLTIPPPHPFALSVPLSFYPTPLCGFSDHFRLFFVIYTDIS